MIFVGCMCIFYFLYTFLLSSLAVAVGVIKEQGLATTPRNDASNNIASLALILVASIWYLGWLGGLIAFAFHFLSLPHSTYGWIFSVPSALRFRRIAAAGDPYAILDALRHHSSRVESRFLVFTWGYFLFMVISFFVVPFSAFRSWWTLPHILIFAAVCSIGFIARMVVGRKLPPIPLPDEDSVIY